MYRDFIFLLFCPFAPRGTLSDRDACSSRLEVQIADFGSIALATLDRAQIFVKIFFEEKVLDDKVFTASQIVVAITSLFF